MAIHYDYKSTRGEKAMKKEAKRKARIEQRRARKSSQSSEKSEDKSQAISLLKKHCCADETIFIQNNEPQKPTDSDFKISSLFISINDLYFIDNININFPKILYSSSKCLIPKRKIYLLNQCLIFYG